MLSLSGRRDARVRSELLTATASKTPARLDAATTRCGTGLVATASVPLAMTIVPLILD